MMSGSAIATPLSMPAISVESSVSGSDEQLHVSCAVSAGVLPP